MQLTQCRDLVREFFEKEQESLLVSYPGLNLSRLLNEVEDFTTQDQYIRFLNSLEKGVPLEYISNKAFFYRSEFHVDDNVLIPRSETEILVERAVLFAKNFNKNSSEKFEFCDIGTGSGAIVLSVIQELGFCAEATATDISKDALEVAKRNNFSLRFRYSKNSKVEFAQADRLDGIDKRFHMILSNPPYIKESEDRHKVHSQVEAYEPHLALYLKDKDYDQWFRTLFSQAQDHLYDNGLFFMEGHEDHLEYQSDILKEYDFKEVEVVKDYTGRNRFLKAIKKGKI